MDVGGVGRRIAYWRERRGLTQEQFGALMGLSRRAIQDIEAGARQADPRLSLLERAAQALSIHIEQLLSDRETPARECVDATEIAALRGVLHQPAGHYPDAHDSSDTPRAVVYGWNAFQAAHYSSLGRLLPGLIVQAHAAEPDECGTLSTAYQLASATMLKFGDPTSAMIAADRAIAAADGHHPFVQASAARRYSDALTHLKDGQGALDTALHAADRLSDDLEAAGPEGWSVYGMLLLKSVMAAAERADAGAVRSLLNQAEAVADRLGHDANHAWSAFGPTNVQLYEVAAMVALGDGAAAVAAAARIGREQLEALPRERRAQLLMDLAAAHALTGRADSALVVLLAAERLAPQEVHCRAVARAGSRLDAGSTSTAHKRVARTGNEVWTHPVTNDNVLYIVSCAAPPLLEIETLIELAQANGWDPCLILTPTAARWRESDLPKLAELTGHPVRSQYKLPHEPDVLPPANAMAVCPATSNTINKWALGISDTLALGLITEAIGKGLPLAALPYCNVRQTMHPAFDTSISVLRAAGVKVLLGDGGFVPHEPGEGKRDAYPWTAVVNELSSDSAAA